MVHISCRIPAAVRDTFDAMARERRRQIGDDVRLADLIREALDEYNERARERENQLP